MKRWIHKIEVIIDRSIPLALLILLVIIILEFAFHDISEKYYPFIQIVDWSVILVFIVDLIFKYIRIRNIPKFLRASWIDILAVFPFFLLFRVIEGFLGIFEASETLTKGQKILHLGVEVEKEIGTALREGEKLAKEASRAERLGKFLNPISRIFRFIKLGNPEVRKEVERQAKDVVKEARKGERRIKKEAKKEIKLVEEELEDIIEDVKEVPMHIKAALFYEKPKIMNYVNKKINEEANKE